MAGNAVPMIRPGAELSSRRGVDVPTRPIDAGPVSNFRPGSVNLPQMLTPDATTAYQLSQLQRPLILAKDVDSGPRLVAYQRRDLLTSASDRVTRAMQSGELTGQAAALARGAITWQTDARQQLESVETLRVARLHGNNASSLVNPLARFPGQTAGLNISGQSAIRSSSQATGAAGVASPLRMSGNPTLAELERKWFDSQSHARAEAIANARLGALMAEWRQDRAASAAAVEVRIAARRQPGSVYIGAATNAGGKAAYQPSGETRDSLSRAQVLSGPAAQTWVYPPVQPQTSQMKKAGSASLPSVTSTASSSSSSSSSLTFPPSIEESWAQDAAQEEVEGLAGRGGRPGSTPSAAGSDPRVDPENEVQPDPAVCRLAPRVSVPIVVTRTGLAMTGWPGTAGGQGLSGPGSLRGKPMRPGTVPARPGQSTAIAKDASRPQLAHWWEAEGRAAAVSAAAARAGEEAGQAAEAAAAEAEALATSRRPPTALSLIRAVPGVKAMSVPAAPPVLSALPALQAAVRAEAQHDADKACARVERAGAGMEARLPLASLQAALVPGLHPTADALAASRPMSAGMAPVIRLGGNPLAAERRMRALVEQALAAGAKGAKKK